MPVTTLSLECPDYYNLKTTCHAHGWVNLAPFFWDDSKETIHFAAQIDGFAVHIQAKQTGKKISARINTHNKPKHSTLQKVKNSVLRSLDLTTDTTKILSKAEKAGAEYVKLVKDGAGRLLRSPTLWEDAAKTLFTTNCSWALTRKICKIACSETFASPAPFDVFPFPAPYEFMKYTTERLKKSMPVGYRAGYLIDIARRFVQESDLQKFEKNRYDHKKADELFRRFKGFGNYACTHLLVLNGYFQKIPIDTVVVSFLKKYYRVRKPKSFINRHYSSWGKDKWWGYQFDRMIKLK